MSKLFDLLAKTTEEKRIQKEISNTEFKKQSLIRPLQSEIQAANSRISGALREIGMIVHAKHLENPDIDYPVLQLDLMEHYEHIADQKKMVCERESKIKEFTERYDEEIRILQSNLTLTDEVALTTEQPTCANCGNAYLPESDLFCTHCGVSLE